MSENNEYRDCFSHLSSAYGTDVPMEVYCRVNNIQTMCRACYCARQEFSNFGQPTHAWAYERAMVDRVNVENISVKYGLPRIRRLIEEWEASCHKRNCEEAIRIITEGYELIELFIIEKKNQDLANQEKEKKDTFIG